MEERVLWFQPPYSFLSALASRLYMFYPISFLWDFTFASHRAGERAERERSKKPQTGNPRGAFSLSYEDDGVGKVNYFVRCHAQEVKKWNL